MVSCRHVVRAALCHLATSPTRLSQTSLGALIGASYAARVFTRQADVADEGRLGALPEAVACHAINNGIAALLPRSAVRAADMRDVRFMAPLVATAAFYSALLRVDVRSLAQREKPG